MPLQYNTLYPQISDMLQTIEDDMNNRAMSTANLERSMSNVWVKQDHRNYENVVNQLEANDLKDMDAINLDNLCGVTNFKDNI